MKEETQGNPEAVDNGVFGSDSDDFFSALEEDVNGLVQDEEVTPKAEAQATPPGDPNNATANVTNGSQSSELDVLKKRYSDSSREAQKMRAQLNELKPFIPVLDAMKQDDGLVSHVKNYFEEGGQVTGDIKKELKLDEDFQFDSDDMINNPESDSRKVFDKMVQNMVDKKANEIMQTQQKQNQQMAYSGQVKKQAEEFMQKHGMTQDEFKAFTDEARAKIQQRGITFEDMYLMVKQGEVSKNVANSTKKIC